MFRFRPISPLISIFLNSTFAGCIKQDNVPKKSICSGAARLKPMKRKTRGIKLMGILKQFRV